MPSSLKKYGGSVFGALLLSSGLSSVALAQFPSHQVSLGQPSYGGSGCPNGSVSAQLSPDAQSLSILFDNFQAEAGGITGRTVDRKACNIAIPVQVPQGYSVSVIKIDYRGYQRLPVNASSSFEVEYFFAGQNGPGFRRNFIGLQDGNFTLSNSLMATANVWSACGESVNLRTNASIAVQTNAFNEQTLMAIDSADYSSQVVYQLQWRTCNGGQIPGGGGGFPGGGGGYPQPPLPPQPPVPPVPPTPYPPQYPGLGPCVINGYMDQRGFQVYMVKDGYGRVLGNTVQYAEALRVAQQAQMQGMCNGVINNMPGGNPVPGRGPGFPGQPRPGQPFPGQPFPGSGGGFPAPNQTFCSVMPGGNGRGQSFFRVVDRAGRIIANTPSVQEANRIARTDARCFQ